MPGGFFLVVGGDLSEIGRHRSFRSPGLPGMASGRPDAARASRALAFKGLIGRIGKNLRPGVSSTGKRDSKLLDPGKWNEFYRK
jgi:hypothetical protein